MKSLTALAVSVLALTLPASAYEWTEEKGKFVDLRNGDQLLVRYVYEAIDTSSDEERTRTYKPFLHVHSPTGGFLTKGPGGKFTHHRGIFFGFSKNKYVDSAGKTHGPFDTWHCKNGAYQLHKKFISKTANEDGAEISVEIDWFGNGAEPFATETRTMSFSQSATGDLIVDFASSLKPLHPKAFVDGDPQHAGFHFRAHNDVQAKNAKQTYYIRPKTGKAEMGKTINWNKVDTPETSDLPWKGMSFVLAEKRYTVAYLDHPENPKPARFSERDYGRFGSYFVKEYSPEQPLKVKYRLVIRDGEMTAEEIAEASSEFVK
ncbi:MAG: DUF6807 family protein [Verrucomicrobiota bacterium]